MPNSRQTSVMASPSRRRAMKRRRSSMAEQAFHGIHTSRRKAESVTHVSGTRAIIKLTKHLPSGMIRLSNEGTDMAQGILQNPIFTDEEKAREWLETQVWPNGPVCPHCGSTDRLTRLQGSAHR